MVEVSVIMPVYNCEKYLSQAIESILNQTFRNFEFIIINDGSTDTSKNIIESYLFDPRIIFINHLENKRLAYSLNEAINLSSGKFIARMDADDISFHNRFELQLDFLKKYPNIKLIGSQYISIDSNGDVLKLNVHPTESIELAYKAISNTYFCHPSIMVNAEILKRISWYEDTDAEDFSFISKIIYLFPCSNLSLPLIYYREHLQNRSHSKSKLIEDSVKTITYGNVKHYFNIDFFQIQYFQFRTNKNKSFSTIILGGILDILVIFKIKKKYKKLEYSYSGLNVLTKIYFEYLKLASVKIIHKWF